MAHTPHELNEEFPEYADKMHELKISDPHYVEMADEYHEINREIHRLEIGNEHLSHFDEEQIRKKRMVLKDKIYSYLKTG
ncbi:MAG: DUF465 domain-containing protein [Alphaproteobacteria bacterium]|nr:DUF465 domain-containing protein [Alphaproteobacteria bacterium]